MLLILIINVVLNAAHPAALPVANKMPRFAVAESLYLNNDLFMSERIFKEIAKSQPFDENNLNSINRLIDIAEKTGDKALFREILAFSKGLNKSKTDAHNSLLYAIGKHLLQTGDYKLAIDFLDTIDKKSTFYTKAVYIKGSCFAELKKYSEALINFETLAKMDNDHVAKDIKDAAILGKARMYVITKKYDSALAEYQRIDTLSIYYLKSLEETARLFVQKKDFENAVLNLETLVFVNKDLYLPDKIKSITDEETFTDFELMKLRILQAYLYIDQQRFDDSRQVFDEVILHYNRIKQDYADALNSFKLSDDLTQVISHPYKDGSPRSMITNPEFVMFLDDTKYSKAFRDWLPEKDKRDFLRTLTLYYSLLQRANSLELKRNTRSLSDEEIRLIELKNIMKSAVSDYIKALVFKVKAQIDEIGLKAQLGKIDIVWKTKEGQTRKIKEIQEKKQENLDVIDTKYKNTAE